MRISSIAVKFAQWGLVPVLAITVGLAVAQGQDHDDYGHGHDNHGDHGHGHDNRGNEHEYHGDHGRDNHGHDHYDNGRGHAYGREYRGEDFHFHGDERDRFAPHYYRDVDHWRRYPHARPYFYPGYYIPRTYVIQPVPPAYYIGMPPPPPGYGYGYYDGYVVAYNPATRIVADAIDLVGTAIAAH
jgi:hypothetical protein